MEIQVDAEYDVVNGLIGLNENILMKLIKQMNCFRKIRNIIGIAEISYEWSKRKIFQFTIFEVVRLPIVFIRDKRDRGVTAVAGKRIVWVRDETDWAILDHEMTRGVVYALTVKSDMTPHSYFGAIAKTLLSADRSELLCNAQGQCCVGWNMANNYIIGSGGDVFYEGDCCSSDLLITLRLEADTGAHTLHFFADGKQLPHVVSNVPPSVYFAICGAFKGTAVTVAAFERLAAPTANRTLDCAVYQWV